MKTSKSRHDTAVQGTNDSSIVSKCSMARLGYFKDEFLHKFVHKQARRAPLIHRGYYIRAKTIDFILKHFLKQHAGKPKQVISLGAGFDSSFFRLKAEGLLDDTVFFEVDFPDVVKRKSCLIQQTEELKSLLQLDTSHHDHTLTELNTEDYKLLGVDLSQLSPLKEILKRCGIRGDNPTLVLSECVLTYMSHTCATDIVRWANEMFSHSVFVLYEQINPYDAFGRVMVNHFQKIGSPLRCIDEYPTLNSQMDRFQACGWKDCEALDMNQFYDRLVTQEERSCIEQIEPFDEFEEWHLKCAHYSVLCAYNGDCGRLLKVCDKFNVSRVNAPVNCKFTWLATCESSSNEAQCKGDNLPECFEISHAGYNAGTSNISDIHSSILDKTDWNNEPSDLSCEDSRKLSPKTASKIVRESCRTKTHSVCHMHQLGHCRHRQTTQPYDVSENYRTEESKTRFSTSVETTLCEKGDNRQIMPVATFLLSSDGSGEKSTLIKRFGHASSQLGNVVLAIGGFGYQGKQHCRLTDAVSLDMNTDMTTIIPTSCQFGDPTNCILDRLHHSAVTLSNDSILVIGGRQSPLKPCDMASPLKLTLKKYAAAAEKVSETENNETTPSMKFGQACQVPKSGKMEKFQNNETFAEQGKDNSQDQACVGDLTQQIKVCRASDTSSLDVEYFSCYGDIPGKRWRHSAVVRSRTEADEVYVYGGRDVSSPALGDCYMLDTQSREWTKVECNGELPGGRHSHTANLWQDHMVIAGGVDHRLSPLNTIHLLHLKTKQWKRYELKQYLKPRYSHTAHVMEDLLILVGGVNFDHTPPGLAMISLSTGHCQEYTLSHVFKGLPVMYHNHTSVLTEDYRLLVIGGGGNCFSFGTHLNASPIALDIRPCLHHFTDATSQLVA